jgi:hypothetical protein
MNYYFFPPQSSTSIDQLNRFKNILTTIAKGTNTTDLVVAHYMETSCNWNGGTAYAANWHTQDSFNTSRGKWKFTKDYDMPKSLPQKFKLIRMQINPSANYPHTEMDRYGWRHSYGTFEDQLAFLFAHELFHFCRYHLGQHPGGGEHAANKWALGHVQSIGYSVKSERIKSKKRGRKKGLSFINVVNPMDFGYTNSHQAKIKWSMLLNNVLFNFSPNKQQNYIKEKIEHFEKLCSLKPGSKLIVDYDPKYKYCQQEVRLIRPLRKNSTRIVIQTGDGKEWRWPMAWLKEK